MVVLIGDCFILEVFCLFCCVFCFLFLFLSLFFVFVCLLICFYFWFFFLTDAEVPVISSIPSNQTVNTDASSPNATVSWTPPTASDNSGEAVTLTSDYGSGDIFPIGTTTVTLTAIDSYGNTATSTFSVVVTGKYDFPIGKVGAVN